MSMNPSLSRRRFVRNAARLAAAATLPQLLLRSKATEQLIVGQGEHRYEVLHDWAKLPDRYTWQTTHNVAVDREGLVYVIHEGREDQKEHPAIFVFDTSG